MSSLKSWLSDRFNLILWMCICEHFASSLQIWHLSCSIPILGNCMGCNWWEFESCITCNSLQQNWYFGPLCNAFVRKDALVVLPWCYITTCCNSFWRASPTIQHIWLIVSYSEQLGPQKKPTKQTNVHLPAFWRYPELNLNVCTKFLLGLVLQYSKYQVYLDALLNHSVFGPNVPFLCHKNAFHGFLTPVVVVSGYPESIN